MAAWAGEEAEQPELLERRLEGVAGLAVSWAGAREGGSCGVCSEVRLLCGEASLPWWVGLAAGARRGCVSEEGRQKGGGGGVEPG